MSNDVTNSKTWNVTAVVEKWNSAGDHEAGLPPDDVVSAKDNLLLNDGINLMLDLLIGAGGTAFTNGNSFIGVGDSTAAAAATQDALQASGYPSVVAQTVTFRSIWASGDGNFAWNEWTISNSNSDSGTNLNRKVAALGTKAAGSSWTLTVTITVS
jgi:hypothetical protein